MVNRIDTHQHFWYYDPQRHDWISDQMSILKKDFLPQELEPILSKNQMKGCISVQAECSEEETDFLLRLSHKNDWILGVVGWLDLCHEQIAERISHWSGYDKLKGIRHIVQDEKDDFLYREDFRKGISLLSEVGWTYDLLVYPRQLNAAIDLVRSFPNQMFVLDHIAKPQIADRKYSNWAEQMEYLANSSNVYCKMSGLVTEANWSGWSYEELLPYLALTYDVFGPDRVMFGSDWPVCLLAAEYGQVVGILERFTKDLSIDNQRKFWSENAAAFYNL